MLMNLRNALMAGKRKPTAKDYVQSGLVAMWDGIENAGWGVHDASATTWKDLCGFFNPFPLDNTPMYFGDDYMMCVNGYYLETTPKSASDFSKFCTQTLDRDGFTLEVLFDLDTSLVINRKDGVFFSTANPGIFSIRTYFAVDSHPVYASSSFGVSSGNSNYVRLNSGTTVKVVFVKDGTSVSRFVFRSDYADPVRNDYTAARSSYTNLNYYQSFFLNKYNATCTFGGKVRGMKLYSRALTAAEIAANYAIDKERFNLPDAT